MFMMKSISARRRQHDGRRDADAARDASREPPAPDAPRTHTAEMMSFDGPPLHATSQPVILLRDA